MLLLPQPCSFEGLTLIQETTQADGPACSQLDDPRPLVSDLDTAHPPATAHIPEHEYTVAKIAKLRGLELKGVPALSDIAEELTDAALPDVGDGLATHPDEMHLEVRMAGGDHRLRISGNRHHPEGTPHDLDVLLRHRPRSISLLGERDRNLEAAV
jgi:hypothetical protein